MPRPHTSWIVLLLSLLALPARADTSQPAVFALIIGVNHSADPDQPALRYADDDAARYLELMRTLGARAYLLTRLDDDTRRLHPQAAAEAQLPRAFQLEAAVEKLAGDIGEARRRGVDTILYVVYAGHGHVEGGQGYITLEDARISGPQLAAEVIDAIGATRTHVLVDACYSVFLAYGRGPGGSRRAVSGFARLEGLAQRPDVGLLLSTSSARESHEWGAFQAGVFSHEVRSGLYGAADANSDGLVSYREIAAFVDRANEAIPNERFRPDVYARPPASSGTLADLRRHPAHRIQIDGDSSAHYILEDARGARVAEFHRAAGHSLELLTGSAGKYYLRRLDDDTEFVITPTQRVTALAQLSAHEPRVRTRGAAHEAFSSIFSLPFDAEVVQRYRFPAQPAPILDWDAPRDGSRRKLYGWSVLGVGLATMAAGLTVTWSADQLGDQIAEATPQREIDDVNHRIRARNRAAGILYGTAAAAVLAGGALLLWPDEPARAPGGLTFDGSTLGYQVVF